MVGGTMTEEGEEVGQDHQDQPKPQLLHQLLLLHQLHRREEDRLTGQAR